MKLGVGEKGQKRGARNVALRLEIRTDLLECGFDFRGIF